MGFWILLALLIGWRFGWEQAHKTVASECKRLGGFYVCGESFKCIEVKKLDIDNSCSSDDHLDNGK